MDTFLCATLSTIDTGIFETLHAFSLHANMQMVLILFLDYYLSFL